MKYRHALLLIFIIILLDQAIKYYVKTHFFYGEEVAMMGNWAKLHFLENEGMAFGMKLGDGSIGKMVLTLFRLVAVVFGFWLLRNLIKKGYGRGIIICGALILAGALGNLIDSLFYGLIFSESTFHLGRLVPFGDGYGHFLQGRVVDMFYFPMVDGVFPTWVPFFGGHHFVFFEPVFNLADAAISIGVLTLVFFQKKLLQPPKPVPQAAFDDTSAQPR